jgi:hypothetical protein
MFQKIVEKIFGSRKAADAKHSVEPSSRYIEPSQFSASFGRDCAPGEALVSVMPTPETAQIQYCRGLTA